MAEYIVQYRHNENEEWEDLPLTYFYQDITSAKIGVAMLTALFQDTYMYQIIECDEEITMTINDLRQKYIGMTFTVKASGKSGTCIQVNGYRKDGAVVIRFCLHLDKGNLWYPAEDIQPVKETLF